MNLASSCLSSPGPTIRIAPASAIAFVDVLEKPAVLGYSVSRALRAVMNVPDRVIGADDGLVRLFDVEMKDARFRVIDPHDGMKMMGHCDSF